MNPIFLTLQQFSSYFSTSLHNYHHAKVAYILRIPRFDYSSFCFYYICCLNDDLYHLFHHHTPLNIVVNIRDLFSISLLCFCFCILVSNMIGYYARIISGWCTNSIDQIEVNLLNFCGLGIECFVPSINDSFLKVLDCCLIDDAQTHCFIYHFGCFQNFYCICYYLCCIAHFGFYNFHLYSIHL